MRILNKLIFRALIAIIFILSTGFFKGDADIYFRISKSIDIFGRVYKEAALNYVDEINPEEFMKAAMDGMLSKLDPYTIFINKDEQSDINFITQGKYGGVGITIAQRNGEVVVMDLMEGYSAHRQGIRIGDIIKKIDSLEVSKLKFNDVSNYVKGEPGTYVKLYIQREGYKELIEFNLLREEIKVKNVSYAGYLNEFPDVGYIKLSNFSKGASTEFSEAVAKLNEQKELKYLVIDLRGNPGGLLDVAVDICDKVLPKGLKILSVAGRLQEKAKEYSSVQEPIIDSKVKLAILVDDQSASASEIFAGAIQDNDRGVIVGRRTFGKGLVQTIFPMPYETSLKLTTARYYTPSGRSIQRMDYALNNKTIENHSEFKKDDFFSLNKRKLESGNGINPDTTVENQSYSYLIQDLIAKGFVFRFSNNYYNRNNLLNYNEIEFEKIFDEFLKFLKDENYVYESKTEKQLKAALEEAKKERFNKINIDNLEKIIKEFAAAKSEKIENFKSEIIKLLKIEFVARFNGKEGRLLELLKNDDDVKTAANILRDEKLYKKILNIKK